jgi:hypothetical protein
MKTAPLLSALHLLKSVLDPILSLALIVGVGIAVWQLFEIVAQTRLQTEALRHSQQQDSVKLALEFRDRIDGSQFSSLVLAIQNHDQNYRLLTKADGGKGGAFRDIDIERYLGNFESMGYLVHDNLIFKEAVYDHFEYDIEKTWCNLDVQTVIRQARQDDKSITAKSDPMWGNFEKLALEFLTRDHELCKEFDKQ